MNPLREYIINFGHLGDGIHLFEYKINDDFFKNFDHSIIKSANINLLLTVEKNTEKIMRFNFQYSGSIDLNCDRCLDKYSFPITQSNKLIVKLGNETSTDDEIVFLKEDEHQIDISSFVYEYIYLAVPLKHVCEEVGKVCNNEMVNLIIKNQKANFAENSDPRWEKLKLIRNK